MIGGSNPPDIESCWPENFSGLKFEITMSTFNDILETYSRYCDEHKDEIAIDMDLCPEHAAAYKQLCKYFKIPLACEALLSPIYPSDIHDEK